MRILRILSLFVVLTAAAPASFTPYLLKNIGIFPASSEPMGFVTLGKLALFQVPGYDASSDQPGLWRSDGTASGTYRLLETYDMQVLAVAGSRCFFSFRLEGGSWRLGITDGTLPGTFSLAQTILWEGPQRVTWRLRQGVLYFSSEGGGHGRELWRSDGTPGGTYEVADVVPGPDSSDPEFLTSFRGQLYFSAGSALWRSDGTAAGTVEVRDVPVTTLQVVGSRLVFIGTDSRGSELWASDGTAAGTHRIADLAEGSASPIFNLDQSQVVGKRLFFSAEAGARGEELYVTDGTAQGTRRLTWFSDPGAIGWDRWFVPGALGNQLFFAAYDPEHGKELWTSDGTPKGTRMLVDAAPGPSSSDPSFFLRFRGRLYYQARGDLWSTDGTAEGTVLIKDVLGGPWQWIADAASDRVFLAQFGDWGLASSLWTTDGTTEGTVKLAEFWGEDLDFDGTLVEGVLLYSGQDDGSGIELWRSDGTPAGTHLLADIADEDIGGSNPHKLMPLGQSVLFFAKDENGYGLWRSDGTEAGTTLVKKGPGFRIGWTASAATRVFFVPNQHGAAVWTSDGTETGTVQLTPDGVRCKSPISAPVVKLGNRVFFSAWYPTYGAEPWVTDGTPQGTRLLADLEPGRGHSYPAGFTVFAGRIWFSAAHRLWMSNGTAKGTIAIGPEWGSIESLLVHAGRLWFLANGRELWSTDGTAAGLRKVDLPASSFRLLLSDGTRLYLSDSRPALWVSDGTAAGTRKISEEGIDTRYGNRASIAFAGRLFYAKSPTGDFYTSDGTAAGTHPVRPDGEPRSPYSLLRFGNRLILATGQELWQSDGTAAGTQRIRDHVYSEAVKAGPRLFFPAWERETGRELWAMRE
ncbi:MAG TPA: ELWxxDGT repeat protein [Thermoanaerobaculia bacterium]|nr:ELWxxDGT repeat protein [Thermoanaerobaculia bacterium]